MVGQFTAPAQALGYLYQVRYALVLLIRNGRERPEIELSVERLDDVAFQEGSAVELLQFKHHLNQEASLADASVELWKTMRVWCTALQEGIIVPGERLLALITTAEASPGSAAYKLRPNAPERDIESARQILDRVAEESTNAQNRAAYVASKI